ncbi:hypothetical protein CY35_08G017000 [Sphagnum magellanicum]|nr:hypothetical protein CY35_08G017000 [Sphagnum magellanicum]
MESCHLVSIPLQPNTKLSKANCPTTPQEKKTHHVLYKAIVGSLITANIIFSNNQSAAQSTKNPKFHEWSKHIDIQVHFICGQMQANIVKLIFCATFDMTTSILTKSLSKDKHLHCVCLMGLRTI